MTFVCVCVGGGGEGRGGSFGQQKNNFFPLIDKKEILYFSQSKSGT